VLFLGRLTDLKGGRFLVEAVRLATERLGRALTLAVAGDGPERPAVEAQARRLGVGTEIHGWVDAARRNDLLRGADVLAVPSVWPEPFGLVGLEAGCVGLPAVAFAVGGIPDWLTAGVSGELAPGDPPTAAGLADALTRALADPHHLARLRRGAWETAGRFTWERHVTQLEAILERVAEREVAHHHG
jgi:glycosyltransferase involved in cell wall biosynthesis